MALEPITRQEKIIAGQDLTPITRMEMFLKQYGGGGGGGGGGSAADFVVNGNLNSDMTVTLDKTFAQIQSAVQEGKQPVVKISENGVSPSFVPMVSASQTKVIFAAVADIRFGAVKFVNLVIKSSGDVRLDMSGTPAINSDGTVHQFPMEADPISPMQIATKKYVDDKECILKSTTPGSTKKFKITVDDSGAISATEVTA